MLRVAVMLGCLGTLLLLIHGFIGSEILEDGTLNEPFYLEALGKLAFVAGAVLAVIGLVLKFLRRG